MTDLNPFDPAKQEVEKRLIRLRNRVQDFLKTFTTATLLKSLGGSGAAVALAAINFPIFAVAVVTVVIVGLSVYAIYATRIMKAQDRDNRWAYVAGKRFQQGNLEARIAVDSATLTLLGERHAPGVWHRTTPELRAALAYHQHRLRLAEQRADAAEAVKEGTASDAQRRAHARFRRQREAAPPKRLAVEPIKARRAALDAERAQLEAEIQSLTTADNIAAAMQAEEVQGARRTRGQRQEDARKADQAARERVRAGRKPTQREPEHVLMLQMAPNGARDVSSARGVRTPEQIAKGEDAA